MLIDCDACAVRGPACTDCVVSVLLSNPAAAPPAGTTPLPVSAAAPDRADLGPAEFDGADLDPAERAAIAVLAGAGLVPPLRLVPADSSPSARSRTTHAAHRGEGEREVS